VGLHHHREPGRQERPGAELGDRQLQVTRGGGDRLGPGAVPGRRPPRLPNRVPWFSRSQKPSWKSRPCLGFRRRKPTWGCCLVYAANDGSSGGPPVTRRLVQDVASSARLNGPRRCQNMQLTFGSRSVAVGPAQRDPGNGSSLGVRSTTSQEAVPQPAYHLFLGAGAVGSSLRGLPDGDGLRRPSKPR
jgi:hypothetical protein